MKVRKITVILILMQVVCIFSLQLKDLKGSWQLQDVDKEYNLKGKVPGGIYTDLMDNKVIGDIFYGDNDMESRWVSKKSWIYTTHFQVDADFLNHKQVNIVFDGLDTFSDIRLNGVVIGTSNNMFLSYTFDIKEHLKVGDNELSVTFHSPVEEAKKLFDEQSKNYSIVPLCVPNEYRGECHVNHIRKMQASFAWDWGPAFPSMGIWKSVRLEAYNNTVIKDVLVQTKEDENNWNFVVITYLSINPKKTLEGSLIITIFSDIGRTESVFPLKLTGGSEFVVKETISLSKNHFKRWWPNGMGEQNLYSMKVTYVSSDNVEQSNKRFKIGLRTVELIQEPLEKGRSFYFKVNGMPFFAKGTNIIPSHILPELGHNETKMRYLLQSSKDVHMNMIRVWGGGIYESDTFYTIADEMGILIWQDFMFACSMYPVNEEFLDTVREEVKQQIRRLQHHASIVLWAGNNENEAALRGNWYGTAHKFETFKDDYVKLYVDTVRKAVFETDETAIFLTSSPTNGVQSDKEGFVAKNPYDPLYGDVHFYNYVLDSWNKNVNPITRFASEYGYQSLPSVQSILSATNNVSDLSISSSFLQHRQHHLLGYMEMQHLIEMRLNLPNRSSSNYDKAFIFYSQIHQAMSIRLETEFYRQWMNYTNDDGKGHTMGALYWQLNDVWIAPSWASIDFNNNWKMLHYYAKEFFAPIIITFHLKSDNNVDVYVISDNITPIFNATLRITTYKWSSFNHVGEIVIRFDIKTGSQKVDSFWLEDYLKNIRDCSSSGEPSENCFLYATLKHEDEDTILAPDNLLMPTALKKCSLEKAAVQIESITKVKDNDYKITIVTDKIAAFVWLESGVSGKFSQNGFFQVTPRKDIYFHSDQITDIHQLADSLTITHLLDKQYL